MADHREEQLRIYRNFDPPVLESLLTTYEARKDSWRVGLVREAMAQHGNVQTQDISRSGQLFKQTRHDAETGRTIHSFTGDPRSWMQQFASPTAVCRFDADLFTGENSPEAKERASRIVTVELQLGERVQIVKD